MKDVMAQNGEDMLVVGAHHSGNLETKAGNFFQSTFNSFSQPRFIFGNQDQGVRSSNLTDKLNETNAKVKEQLALQPNVGVGLNISVSSDRIEVHTRSKFFAGVEGEYYLSLYFIENNVVDEQASLGSAVEHPMVLRTAFTDNGEGMQIANGVVAQDFEIENDFTLIRQPEWNLDNSYVYGIIWKKEGEQFIYENGHRSEVMNPVISTRDENYLSGINVYPTISDGLYQVDIPAHLVKDVDLSVLDRSGKVLNQIDFDPQVGVSRLDLTQLPAGQYFLAMRLREAIKTTSLVKQ